MDRGPRKGQRTQEKRLEGVDFRQLRRAEKAEDRRTATGTQTQE